MRIRSRRQAEKLRPIAVERARQSKFKPGDRVFWAGITNANVTIVSIFDRKPYRKAFLVSLYGNFFIDSMTACRPYQPGRG